MSKEDLTCKISSGCKHKERKPKKPHYIPRPWGKPYNYKCFQCPFTCMEKSHLYNHMKYSLCKNSLSLLIESDWPYKKGNMLHPDQLRSLQQGPRHRGAGREAPEVFSGAEDQSKAQQTEVTLVDKGLEEIEGHGDMETGQRKGTEVSVPTKEASDQTDSSTRAAAKRSRQSEADLLITDVFPLDDQLLKHRPAEVETQLKQYKLSKGCLSGPSLLSEQWRLLATSHRKAKSDSSPLSNGSLPCYPPPPAFADCPDPAGLNLSVLGVSYPLSPSLFSYVNPTVPGAASTHSQMGQLPFLASATQFMHPASSSLPHADRPLLSPRFYYPLLCEHAFGAARVDAVKGAKPGQSTPAALDSGSSPGFTPKINLWKVPALRPSPSVAPPASWTSHHHVPVSLEAGYRVTEEKVQPGCKDNKAWGFKSTLDMPLVREHGSKRTGAPMEVLEGPVEKKTTAGCALDLLKNIHITPTISIATDGILHPSSFRSAIHHSKSLEDWNTSFRKSASENLSSEMSPPLKPERVRCLDLAEDRQGGQISETAAALLADFSRALQEYQEAERKVSHLVREDHPSQRPLWEYLCKIRSELSHIHHALEKTTWQNEGPLDLSIKKNLGGTAGGENQCTGETMKGEVIGETEEEDEMEDEEEEGGEREGKAELLESQKQELGVLMKMNAASLAETSPRAMVKTEVLSPGALGLRAAPVEALWPSRTTKCEADSSVLLCPDGRPIVFTDFTAGAKSMKRPASREHLGETLCPPSPLTSNDL
uniref:Proline rich 35 n=1 Tax=Paramormyrops kingsleyae TaxID=1676925 RepID=A0A3B3S3S3_9TELE|nr:proline-rich protein 35 [Paramormyrops kingsleyae]